MLCYNLRCGISTLPFYFYRVISRIECSIEENSSARTDVCPCKKLQKHREITLLHNLGPCNNETNHLYQSKDQCFNFIDFYGGAVGNALQEHYATNLPMSCSCFVSLLLVIICVYVQSCPSS